MITVRRCTHDHCATDHAVGAGTVLGRRRLAPGFGELLREPARQDVAAADGELRRHQAHLLVRVRLRVRNSGQTGRKGNPDVIHVSLPSAALDRGSRVTSKVCRETARQVFVNQDAHQQ